MHVITLTTDFGAKDWFVGTMKGVILSINPRAAVVDITHEAAPGDIHGGAFALAASCRYFPQGTVHVAVVDPGVGGPRKAIAVQTAEYWYVGPDNGVLSFALRETEIKSIHRLENAQFLLRPVSPTFQGRDVFAPAAAHLSRGVPIRKLGLRQEDIVRLAWPEPQIRQQRIDGEIIYLDRFGNAITNIRADDLGARGAGQVLAGRRRLALVGTSYQSVARGKAVAVRGSSGFLEIAVNGGSAARRFHLDIGTRVTLR